MMNNELEKQFFQCFGIEPRGKKCTCAVRDFAKCTTYYCTSCAKALEKEYPQITDRILLELICIVLNTFETFEVYRIMDIDSLKEKILKLSMLAKDDVYSQVRTLFEEG